MQPPNNLIIDTDMGLDDIMAIAMLAQSSQFCIKAFSTVFGVTSVNQGTSNLSRILSFMQKDIPIYKGKARASQNWKASFPSSDRLRANQLTPLNALPIPQKDKDKVKIFPLTSVPLMQSQESPLCLVCLGPLTNIAYLIEKYGNSFTDKIDQIIMMGGAVNEPGNVLPLKKAEYNIYLDPEAAQVVFNSSIPKTLVPINATKWVPISATFTDQIRTCTPYNPTAQIIQAIIEGNTGDFNQFYDPLVAGIMVNPSIVLKKYPTSINVVLNDSSRGQTCPVSSFFNKTEVITKIDALKFYQTVQNAVQRSM